MRAIRFCFFLAVAFIVGSEPHSASAQFTQTNLTSDIPGQANNTDPNLVNPWGMSFSATSPTWISDERAGKATLYNGAGVPQALVVTIPGVGGNAGTPTGTVFNSAAGAFNGDVFLFSTLTGQIAGWRGALGTTAEILSSSSANAVFTGLAIGSVSGNVYAYATDFRNGTIDPIKGLATAPALPGNFTDPNAPAGFSTFNVQNLGGQLFVTFAKQDPTTFSPIAGVGNGLIDIFDLSGNFLKRLVTGGQLNDPWGLALAPSNFGPFGGDLLVGNHGDGTIDAFDPITGLLIGELKDAQGNPIINLGLWALAFGNGAAVPADALLFTAGINGGANGLFGEIQAGAATPLPAALPLFSTGLGALGLLTWHRKRKRALALVGRKVHSIRG
jgi:uncharacterized protein (TIGR03118 family)